MAMDTGDGLRRALTPLAVLRLLTDGPAHGYSLIGQLKAAGFVHAQGGTVYPLLRSLEEEGLVASAWDLAASGPARKVFELTPAGRARLAQDERVIQNVLSRFESLARKG